MLGEKIRNYRKEAKKTLNQISEATGLSASYLSQLEHNHIDPSLSALRKIAAALELPTHLFLAEDSGEDGYIVRKKERIVMNFSDSPTSYEVVSTMPNKSITPEAMVVSFTVRPGTYDADTFVSHNSDEICLVEKGELTVYYGGNTAVLNEGDTILIPKNTPHRFFNHMEEDTTGYAITSPCTWPRNNR